MNFLSAYCWQVDEQQYFHIRRIYFYLLGFVCIFFLRAYQWSAIDPVFWQPISFYRIFSAPPIAATPLLALNILFPLFCFINGSLRSALISFLTALMGLLVLSYGFNFGKIDHYYSIAAIVLIVDFIHLLGSKLDKENRFSWNSWYIRFIQFAIGMLYFASALRKVWASGFEWFASDNMKIMLLDHQTTAGAWLAHTPYVPKLLAFSAWALELLSPLAVLTTPLTVLFVSSWLLMHFCIYIFMGPNFITHVIAMVFFSPQWSRFADKNRQMKFTEKHSARAKQLIWTSFAIYTLIGIYQFTYKLDSWPFSCFPMYEENYSLGPIKRYILKLNDKTAISFASFSPFTPQELERSLRKSAEKQRYQELSTKLSFLNSHYNLNAKFLTLRELHWENMKEFDPEKPETDTLIYQWPETN